MSGFTVNGVKLSDLCQGTVQTGGSGFTGSGTGTGTGRPPSKTNPGLNFGMSISGTDIRYYNSAKWQDFNGVGYWNSFQSPPSWCNHVSYVLLGGGGGCGGWCGYCLTTGNYTISQTLARSGGRGGYGGRYSGTYNVQGKQFQVYVGPGGTGGSGATNLWWSGGNSQVMGYDARYGTVYDNRCFGNNGGMGGTTYIKFNNGQYYTAGGGGGGNRATPGCVRRFSYGDHSEVLSNSNAGNQGTDASNSGYNSTNYGTYNQRSPGFNTNNWTAYNTKNGEYGYPWNSNSWTYHADNYNSQWLANNYGWNDFWNWVNYYYGANISNYNGNGINCPQAPSGDKGWVRVFFRIGDS